MSPRTKKQFEEIREEKKRLIMEVALSLFAQHGYENTSISQIAKQANISKGLLYNYFVSKEELLQAILNSGIDEIIAVFDPNKDGILEVTEMIFFINETFKMIEQRRQFWRLYMSISLQPSVFKLIEERIEELYKPLTKMMVNYFTDLGYENPLMESILFGALIDGITMEYLMKPDVFPIQLVKNELIIRYCSRGDNQKSVNEFK